MWSPRPPISGGRTASRASSCAATSAAGRSVSRPPTWRRAQYTAIPADGVYAGWLTAFDPDGPELERWPAAISVGSNPTFDGAERTVEAYALDRDDLDLYGTHVAVDFATRLRDMVRFGSVDELVAQMHRDVDAARPQRSKASAASAGYRAPPRSTIRLVWDIDNNQVACLVAAWRARVSRRGAGCPRGTLWSGRSTGPVSCALRWLASRDSPAIRCVLSLPAQAQ